MQNQCQDGSTDPAAGTGEPARGFKLRDDIRIEGTGLGVDISQHGNKRHQQGQPNREILSALKPSQFKGCFQACKGVWKIHPNPAQDHPSSAAEHADRKLDQLVALIENLRAFSLHQGNESSVQQGEEA